MSKQILTFLGPPLIAPDLTWPLLTPGRLWPDTPSFLRASSSPSSSSSAPDPAQTPSSGKSSSEPASPLTRPLLLLALPSWSTEWRGQGCWPSHPADPPGTVISRRASRRRHTLVGAEQTRNGYFSFASLPPPGLQQAYQLPKVPSFYSVSLWLSLLILFIHPPKCILRPLTIPPSLTVTNITLSSSRILI